MMNFNIRKSMSRCSLMFLCFLFLSIEGILSQDDSSSTKPIPPPLPFGPFGPPPPTMSTPRGPYQPDGGSGTLSTIGDLPDFFGLPAPTKDPRTKVHKGNLTCFVCKLDFRSGYNPSHPCLGRHASNLSDRYLTNCGPEDIFCRVERTEVNGMLILLSRECVDQCFYGCRPKGFGISFEACAECCNSFACNNFYPLSVAIAQHFDSLFILYTIIFSLLLQYNNAKLNSFLIFNP